MQEIRPCKVRVDLGPTYARVDDIGPRCSRAYRSTNRYWRVAWYQLHIESSFPLHQEKAITNSSLFSQIQLGFILIHSEIDLVGLSVGIFYHMCDSGMQAHVCHSV